MLNNLIQELEKIAINHEKFPAYKQEASEFCRDLLERLRMDILNTMPLSLFLDFFELDEDNLKTINEADTKTKEQIIRIIESNDFSDILKRNKVRELLHKTKLSVPEEITALVELFLDKSPSTKKNICKEISTIKV